MAPGDALVILDGTIGLVTSPSVTTVLITEVAASHVFWFPCSVSVGVEASTNHLVEMARWSSFYLSFKLSVMREGCMAFIAFSIHWSFFTIPCGMSLLKMIEAEMLHSRFLHLIICR